MKVHGQRLRRADRRPPKPISMPFERKYVSKAYLVALPMCLMMLVVIYLTYDDGHSFLLIISYVFYPFAKFFYDVVIGFWLGRKIKKASNYAIEMSLDKIQYAMYGFFVYFSSLLLAPLGMLFLLIRYLFRLFWVKRRI
ncbi:hypothetical protein [Terribacillus saccharophilus]|uniref:hypothetical protein n=1 Tax=Terribacillus saccharophilus TaxID=361277 RepID=UPI002989FC01|nr:hypothetical protein [Terribacillus saccharophilus]MCM3227368.1 hypothetical protein [Terribacillus saccharophilus]